MQQLKILYVGPDYPGSNGTCWRNAFQELGHNVLTVDDEKLSPSPRSLAERIRFRILRRPAAHQIAAVNHSVVQAVREFRPDLTFYVKGYYVLPETLEETRRFGLNFAYMNDDMFIPGVATFTFWENIKHMDCIVTTKSFSVREYHNAGAPLAVYMPNAYDPKIHYPAVPSPAELQAYAGDVAFIGNFHPWKADFLAELARYRDEFRINIWGLSWNQTRRADYWTRWGRWKRLPSCLRGKPLWCAEMGKAIQANNITLGLLLRHVRDLHTSRSFEIPACGGFMLADRTEEHRMYFEEDKEAVYFSSHEELVDKIRFYLAHEDRRQKIAEAGFQRCLRSNARYVDRAQSAIDQYRRLRPRQFASAGALSAGQTT
jgi:spore maturation protein CgeB